MTRDDLQRGAMEALPAGWEQVRLGDVCRTGSGGTPSRKKRNYFGDGIPWLKSGELNGGLVISTAESITQEGLERSNCKILSRGTLLIALYGATVGKLGILGLDAAINQAICAISTPPEIDSKYLLWFLSAHRNVLLNARKGGAQPNISQQIVNDVCFPLAPLNEQRRIVSKIEQLFSDLDAGVAALQKAKEQLKRYRQAVLKAAVEGKLTAEWRAANAGKIEPASVVLERVRAERSKSASGKAKPLPPLDATALGELPEGWCWSRIDNLAHTIGGVTKGRHFEGNKTVSLPYLRVANVQRGFLDLAKMKEIDILETEVSTYLLEENDLLLTEGGDWDKLGRSAIWRGEIPNCIHQNHIFRARLYLSEMPVKWVMFYTNSEQGRAYFVDASKQTTNLASINLTQLRSCPIPVPPLLEQQQIVAEIDRRLSVADEVERTVDASLAQAERLRQSILKRAFAGKLLPQDPNDEPAERLLERIKAARRAAAVGRGTAFPKRPRSANPGGIGPRG